MGKVRIPYYVVRGGRGFWQPNGRMRADGARCVPCGLDGPAAWMRAREAHEAWQARIAVPEPPQPRLMPGTLPAAFAEYRQIEEWKLKKARTKEEWERCWRNIKPAFGDENPSAVTLADISRFRLEIERQVSLREAHRCIKIWRALWQVCAALHYCDANKDPSFGMRNREPKPRSAVWTY